MSLLVLGYITKWVLLLAEDSECLGPDGGIRRQGGARQPLRRQVYLPHTESNGWETREQSLSMLLAIAD